MNYGPQNQGPGNCGTAKGVEKIVEESDLVLQSQHFLTIVIASIEALNVHYSSNARFFERLEISAFLVSNFGIETWSLKADLIS